MKKISLCIIITILVTLLSPVNAFAVTNAQTYYNKAEGFFKAQKYQEAINNYDLAIKTDSKYALAYRGKGVALISLKKYDEAIKALDTAIQLNSKDVDALIHKARALNNLKKTSDALGVYDIAIGINPKLVVLYLEKGDVLYDMKKYEEAIKVYDVYLKLASSAYVQYSKGSALHQLGKYEEAISVFDSAIKINPKYGDAYLSKGNSLNLLKRYDEAAQCFDIAQKLAPNDISINVSRGNIFYFKGMYDEAIKYYDIAIKANVSLDSAYNNKGKALYYSSKYSEAIDCLNQALNHEADNEAEINYFLSLAYIKKGDIDKYLPFLKQAISLDSSYMIYARTNEGFKDVAANNDFVELIYDATETLNAVFKNSNIFKEDKLAGIKFLDMQSTGDTMEDVKILQAQKDIMGSIFMGNVYNETTAVMYHIANNCTDRSDIIKAGRFYKGLTLVGYKISYSLSDNSILFIGKTSNEIKAVIVKGTYTIKLDGIDIPIMGVAVLISNNGIWEYNGGLMVSAKDNIK